METPATTDLDVLSFEIEETPDSGLGRRQAVPLINGERLTSILGLVVPGDRPGQSVEMNIGVEPEDAFLPSRHYLEPTCESNPEGTTILLRCSCGVMDCTYVAARLEIDDPDVFWRDIHVWPEGGGAGVEVKKLRDLHFSKAQYEQALRGPQNS